MTLIPILCGLAVVIVLLTIVGKIFQLNKTVATTSTRTPIHTSVPPTPSVSANPTPTGANQPKAKSNGVVGGIVVVGLVIALVLWVGTGLLEMSQNQTQMRSKPEAVWGPVKVCTLTSEPTVIPWPIGARDGTIARIEQTDQTSTRKFFLRSGNQKFTLLGKKGEKESIRISTGKPVILTSVDGKPLDITIKWLIK